MVILSQRRRISFLASKIFLCYNHESASPRFRDTHAQDESTRRWLGKTGVRCAPGLVRRWIWATLMR
jgi:hypothetical protein